MSGGETQAGPPGLPLVQELELREDGAARGRTWASAEGTPGSSAGRRQHTPMRGLPPPVENSVGRGLRRTSFALQTALVPPNKASHHCLR